MDFRAEQEMLGSVLGWLVHRVSEYKTEFNVPWGYCDVVGCTLSARRTLRRLRLGQKQTIGPLERVSVLWEIPEARSGTAVSLSDLMEKLAPLISPSKLVEELTVLESRGFLKRVEGCAFQRENGWFPLQEKLIAIELKLDRIAEVIEQAERHLLFADESYIALPMSTARAIARSSRKYDLRRRGIGLIGVSANASKTILAAARSRQIDPVVQAHCVERFWRTSLISN